MLMNGHQGATTEVTYRRSWPDPRALDYPRMFVADPDTQRCGPGTDDVAFSGVSANTVRIVFTDTEVNYGTL